MKKKVKKLSVDKRCAILEERIEQLERAIGDLIYATAHPAALNHYEAPDKENNHGYTCPGESGKFDQCNCGYRLARKIIGQPWSWL